MAAWSISTFLTTCAWGPSSKRSTLHMGGLKGEWAVGWRNASHSGLLPRQFPTHSQATQWAWPQGGGRTLGRQVACTTPSTVPCSQHKAAHTRGIAGMPSCHSPQAGGHILWRQGARRDVVQRVVERHDGDGQAVQGLAQLGAQLLQGPKGQGRGRPCISKTAAQQHGRRLATCPVLHDWSSDRNPPTLSDSSVPARRLQHPSSQPSNQ